MTTRHEEFPSATLAPCLACQRLRLPVRGKWACNAFPSGIPAAYLNAEVDHRVPHPGDGGIRFEPDWSAPEDVLALVRAG